MEPREVLEDVICLVGEAASRGHCIDSGGYLVISIRFIYSAR